MGECCSGQSWTVRLLATGQSRKSARFAVPRHLTLVLPPLADPITVQLYNGTNGLCWGADDSLAQMRRNDAGRLRAKAP